MTATDAVKHTPGPWRANKTKSGHEFVGGGMWFAKVAWTVNEPKNDADARLISAAPDLLEALRGLLSRYHIMGCGDGLEALEAARVIAKAEGAAS